MASNRPPHPAHIKSAHIMAERVELYRRFPPLGESIKTKTDPFAINDYTPLMDKIYWEVHRLWRHHLGGPSVMRTEHLHSCLVVVTQEERPDTSNWEQVVDIHQMVFIYGRLPEEYMWKNMVMIPMGY